MSDVSADHPSPHRSRVSFTMLLIGTTAAPIFWLGQLMLGYSVSDLACYGSDHPTVVQSPQLLHIALIAFDAIAVVAALAGLAVSTMNWRATREEKAGGHVHALEVGEGRARFLSLWGLLSSSCFLMAVLFTAYASLTMPLCAK